ncbi:MAG: choice-of-anchor B family protein [Flavobacteriales bacterium]
MKKIVLAASLFITAHSCFSQLNITFQGNLDYQALHGSNLSNLWGYTDENGNEYAIVGTEDGVSVVNVTNPAAPVEIFYEPGSNTIWREVKTFGDYAYISTEETDGMMIINLGPLPGSTVLPVTYFFGAAGNQFQTAHSLFIDENGILFLHGTDVGNGGIIMYDVAANPTNPPEVGMYDNWYVHDGFARGDTVYAAHIYDGFVTIADVSTPTSPAIIGGPQNTPMTFSHNVWLDNTGDYMFTTDEVSAAWIGAYDISNLGNISEVDRIRRSETSGSIPHNTYWLNKYIITSYYRDGVTIHDVSNPANMIEVGHYDTSPLSGNGFNGAWGVYPYLPSGNLLISDMEEGLFVLAPTYVRGCYLEGNVTEQGTGTPLGLAHVEIVGNANFDDSDLSGFYAAGVATAGSYSVIYSKPGYFPDTVIVNLVNNTTVVQNVQLVPLPVLSIGGQITDAITTNGIMNVQVLIQNSVYTYSALTDGNGNFSFSPFSNDTANANYNVTIGLWGYVTQCMNMNIDGTTGAINVALSPGFYDDFALDFGWTVTGNASDGIWDRGEPVGTTIIIQPCNPDFDVNGDCSDQAYVTGNGGGSAGNDDVDGGNTILISPAFSVAFASLNSQVNYYLWMQNAGGTGSPEDTVTVILNDNGVDINVFKATVNNHAQGTWVYKSFSPSTYTTSTTGLRLKIKAEDYAPGHVVEAALDEFQVVNAMGVNEMGSTSMVLLYPNPGHSNVTIESIDPKNVISEVRFFDMSGKMITPSANKPGVYDISTLPSGMYVVEVRCENGTISHLKFIRD